jgi:8-hydroxy-5-deazaflavin:NADPH oxidoreductase
MNPYGAGGEIIGLGGTTSSEEVQKRLPGARLVKAFNTIYYHHLATLGSTALPLDRRYTIFVAGDDAEAKQVAAKLIEEIGFAPADTGSLRQGGRKQEPGSRKALTAAPRTATG